MGTERSGGAVRALGTRRGYALVEIAVVTLLLVVAIGSLSRAVMSAIELSRANEQTAIADDAARRALAELRTVLFSDIFATHVAAPDFDVPELTPRVDDPDGMVGRILFPTEPLAGGGLALREDVEDADLGLPRDLNGDGDVDALDHSGDYLVLPVTVRLEWRGVAGDRWTELNALLVE